MIFWRVLREGWASQQCQDIFQGQWPGPRWGPGSQGQVWHRGREVSGGRRPEVERPQHLRPLGCRGRELRGGLRGLWQHPPLPEVQECGECPVIHNIMLCRFFPRTILFWARLYGCGWDTNQDLIRPLTFWWWRIVVSGVMIVITLLLCY